MLSGKWSTESSQKNKYDGSVLNLVGKVDFGAAVITCGKLRGNTSNIQFHVLAFAILSRISVDSATGWAPTILWVLLIIYVGTPVS
jgi:hypothetical protein